MSLRVVLLASIAFAAPGCGGEDPAPAALSEPITYEAIGGDAFRDDTIVVRPDGTASVQTRAGTRSATLTPAERAKLARGIADAALTDRDDAVSDATVPDALSYRFTYRGHQVTADSAELPDDLRPLIGTFDGLIDRYGA